MNVKLSVKKDVNKFKFYLQTHFVLYLPLLFSCGVSTSESLIQTAPQVTPSTFNEPLRSGRPYTYGMIKRSVARLLTRHQFIADHPQTDTHQFGYLFDPAILADHDQGQTVGRETIDQPNFIPISESLIQQRGIKNLDTAEQAATVPWEALRSGYHNHEQLTEFLKAQANEYPAILTLTSLGLSIQNRDLWMVKISDQPAVDETEPKVLFVANMHGDEVVGREMMLRLISELTSQYGTNSEITDMIDHSQIFIIPSMNPDGFELHQRFNAEGVDLNRDFPDFTSDPTNSPSGRAPETRAIMNLFKKHFFVVSANFHGGEVCFNLPWDTKANDSPLEKFGDDSLIASWGRSYADINPTMKRRSGGSFDRGVTYGYEWYEVDGGLQDWSIHYNESIHGTVELSYAKWPPARELPRFWEENKTSLLGLLGRAREGIHLEIVHGKRSLNVGNPPLPEDPPLPPVTYRVSVKGHPRTIPFSSPAIHRSLLRPAGSDPDAPPMVDITIEVPGLKPLETSVPWNVYRGTFTQIVVDPENRS